MREAMIEEVRNWQIRNGRPQTLSATLAMADFALDMLGIAGVDSEGVQIVHAETRMPGAAR